MSTTRGDISSHGIVLCCGSPTLTLSDARSSPWLIDILPWSDDGSASLRRRCHCGQPHGVGRAGPTDSAMSRTQEVLHPARASQGERSIDQICINTIRTLAMDAVEQAKSGHPGTPMALAPVAYTLWQRFLRYDPDDPQWPNRDRFVLSAGHASMLLYAMLHLSGVRRVEGHNTTDKPAVSLNDIKDFRQIASVTPGHPEYGHTTGVETTTGPLGQGCGNSVGMAMASRWLAAHYNRPDFTLF